MGVEGAVQVVYLLTPTSNHNWYIPFPCKSRLYIFWLLHQTTTMRVFRLKINCCISFDSYIKPQLSEETTRAAAGCISFDSYIKPQPTNLRPPSRLVVYLLTPTSNHNFDFYHDAYIMLYIFWLLHQTTTTGLRHQQARVLYIFWLLHQTTTLHPAHKHRYELYIFWLLHQTTTKMLPVAVAIRLYIFWLLHQTTTSADSW